MTINVNKIRLKDLRRLAIGYQSDPNDVFTGAAIVCICNRLNETMNEKERQNYNELVKKFPLVFELVRLSHRNGEFDHILDTMDSVIRDEVLEKRQRY
jgi:hypothetical protein